MKLILRIVPNQVGLLLANGVPLKYKGTVEVIESEFIVKQEILL
jgi:hypothetical protein